MHRRIRSVPSLLLAAVLLASIAVPSPALDALRPLDSEDGDPPVLHMLLEPARIADETASPGPLAGRAIPFDLATNGVPPEGDSPSAVCFTPDGSKIVVAHRASRNLIVVDAVTRVALMEIALSGSPGDLAVSPDGDRAVTANLWEDTASIVDLTTGIETAAVPVGDQPCAVRISPDGAKAVVGNTVDGTLSVIDIATATETRRIANAGFVGGVSLNFENAAIQITSSKFAFAGATTIVHPDYYGNRIQIFDIVTGATTTLNSLATPHFVAVTPSGTTAVVSHAGTVRQISVIDVPTKTITKTIPIGADLYGPISINPSGTKAVVHIQNACRVVDLATNALSPSLNTASVSDLLTTADGSYALGVGYYGSLVSYATQTIVANLNNTVSTSLGAVSPAGPRAALVATTFGEDMVVVNTNGAGGHIEGVVPSGAAPEGDAARIAAWAPDGSRLVMTNILSDNATVLNGQTYAVEAIVACGDRPAEVAIDPAGGKAVVTNLDSPFLTIIDLASHTKADVTISRRASQVEISPDGQHAYAAVLADGDGVWRVNLTTYAVEGAKLATGNMGAIGYMYNQTSGMTLSHDGATLVTCNSFDNTISLIDTAAWSVAATVAVPGFPVRAIFAPDDAMIFVSCRDDNRLRAVTNAGGGSAVVGTAVVGQQPYEMVLSPDASTLYVANFQSETIGFVDVESFTQFRITPLPDPPVGVSLSANGGTVYAGSGNWQLQLGPGPRVVLQTFGQFSAIDEATGTIEDQADLAIPPAMQAWNPDGAKLALPSPFGDGALIVWVIDPASAEEVGAHSRLTLAPPAPNPMGSTASIGFSIPAAARVELSVHDAAGRFVRSLANADFAAGEHHVDWDGLDGEGRPCAPGVYFVRARAGEIQRSAKLLIAD